MLPLLYPAMNRFMLLGSHLMHVTLDLSSVGSKSKTMLKSSMAIFDSSSKAYAPPRC